MIFRLRPRFRYTLTFRMASGTFLRAPRVERITREWMVSRISIRAPWEPGQLFRRGIQCQLPPIVSEAGIRIMGRSPKDFARRTGTISYALQEGRAGTSL